MGNEPLSDQELEALREQARRWKESKGFECIERVRVYESLDRSAPEPSRILAVEIRGRSEFLEALNKVHQARREFWRTQPKKTEKPTEQEREEWAEKDDEFYKRLRDLQPGADKLLDMLEYFQPENMKLIVDSGIAKVLRKVEAQNHADEDHVNNAERLEWYDRWVVCPCDPGEEIIDPDEHKERMSFPSTMECRERPKSDNSKRLDMEKEKHARVVMPEVVAFYKMLLRSEGVFRNADPSERFELAKRTLKEERKRFPSIKGEDLREDLFRDRGGQDRNRFVKELTAKIVGCSSSDLLELYRELNGFLNP